MITYTPILGCRQDLLAMPAGSLLQVCRRVRTESRLAAVREAAGSLEQYRRRTPWRLPAASLAARSVDDALNLVQFLTDSIMAPRSEDVRDQIHFDVCRAVYYLALRGHSLELDWAASVLMTAEAAHSRQDMLQYWIPEYDRLILYPDTPICVHVHR